MLLAFGRQMSAFEVGRPPDRLTRAFSALAEYSMLPFASRIAPGSAPVEQWGALATNSLLLGLVLSCLLELVARRPRWRRRTSAAVVAFISVLAVLATRGACASERSSFRFYHRASDLRASLVQTLPRGTTKAEVFSFISREGWACSPVDGRTNGTVEGTREEIQCRVAAPRLSHLLVAASWNVRFHLVRDRLSDVEVDVEYTGM